MDNAESFEGKTLDQAIQKACSYFGVPREKLEIDIIQDAKTGIFGIVGARKAIIKAARIKFSTDVGNILGAHRHIVSEARKISRDAEPVSCKVHGEKTAQRTDEAPEGRSGPCQAQTNASTKPDHAAGSMTPVSPVAGKQNEEANPEPDELTPDNAKREATAEASTVLAAINLEELRSATIDVVTRLITPIVDNFALEVEISSSRIAVHINSEGDLGLLIGREGQTLACLRYLTSRILAHKFNAPIRIQLEAGDYRERQDEKLCSLALILAERAKESGRPCATRPLSAYQRRLVHMTLQNDHAVQTRSAGEGPLKRVIIQRVRSTARDETR